MITDALDIECKEYIKNSNKILEDISRKMKNGEILCPDCLSRVKIQGFYDRKVKLSEFESVKVMIIQTRCVNRLCRKTHAILPSFLIPKKKYEKSIVLEAVHNIENYCGGADESTVWRWKNQLKK